MNENEDFELLDEARSLLEIQDLSMVNQVSDFLVCECKCISSAQIRNYLESNNLSLDDLALKKLTEELGLGTGCSSCIKSFKDWKQNI